MRAACVGGLELGEGARETAVARERDAPDLDPKSGSDP